MKIIGFVSLLVLNSCQPDTVDIGHVSFVESSIDVANGEISFAVDDLDGDGHLDLVVASADDDNISVFRGNGNGMFSRGPGFPAGENPSYVAIADIDEDGLLDVVVANHETSYLTLLLGDGHGALQPASNSPLTVDVDPHPHVVKVVDMDRDGHVDIVVDDRNRRGLRIARGLGSGAFEKSSLLIDVGGDPYLGFATEDINNDGRPDLITPNPDEVAVVVSDTPTGLTFDSAVSVDAGTPFAVEIADVNSDGYLDIVAASDGSSSSVRTFVGTGNSNFREARESSAQIAPGAKNVAAGDFNGDGVGDVLASSWNSEVLVILGGAEPFESVRLMGTGNPWGLAVGDFNEDGNDDFVIADGIGSSVRVFLSLE